MHGAHWQPRLNGRKSGQGCCGGPRHGRARAIPSEGLRPIGNGFRVLQTLKRHVGLRKPQLLALIDKGVAAQAHQQEEVEPRHGGTIFVLGPARDGPRRVMIGKSPAWPTFLRRTLPGGEGFCRQRGVELVGIEKGKAIGAVQPVISGCVEFHLRIGLFAADLSNGKAVSAIGGEEVVNSSQELRNISVGLVMQMVLKVK